MKNMLNISIYSAFYHRSSKKGILPIKINRKNTFLLSDLNYAAKWDLFINNGLGCICWIFYILLNACSSAFARLRLLVNIDPIL